MAVSKLLSENEFVKKPPDAHRKGSFMHTEKPHGGAKEGYKWTGELGALDSHLNLDSQPANQLKGCKFVKCTHCSKSHQRRNINHHQSEVCPKRPFTCEHCKDYKSTFEDVTTNHWSVCGCYPVPCSNKCGAVLQRQNIESHIAKDCSMTVIKCDFHGDGCEVRLPRTDMGEHLHVELVTHISMMADSHQQQITSLQQQITSLQQQIANQKQQIASLQQQIASQEKEIASYKQQQDQDRQRMSELVKENETLKQRVNVLEWEQKRDQALIKVLHPELNPLPFDITMYNFEEHKKSNDKFRWFSPPFYTHHRGYKLCLISNANGAFKIEDGKWVGTHVSVFFHMMRGEFDDELKWPFCGEITIQLLSQDGSNEHCTKTITLDNPEFYARVTEGDRCGYGQGESRFISHDDCYKQFIKNDNLYFQIVKVTLK